MRRCRGEARAPSRLPPARVAALPRRPRSRRRSSRRRQRVEHLLDALPGRRRTGRAAASPARLLELLAACAAIFALASATSALVERHDLRLVVEPVRRRPRARRGSVAVGLAGSSPARVDQMQQHGAALDVAEEAVAEARAFVRALDQAGNVGEHELAALVRGRRRGWDAAW